MHVFAAVGILLALLKVLGHIDWPWIWVTSPFWFGGILGILAVILHIRFYRALERLSQRSHD